MQATQIESLKPPNLNVSKENRRVGFCLIVDPQFWRYFGPHFYRLLEILGNRCVEDSGLAKDFYLREPEEEREWEGKSEQRKGGIREFFLLTFVREELS